MDVVNILTPVGRMVQGSPFEEQTTDMKGKQLTNAQGQPRSEYFFAIAIPKTDPAYAAMYAQIQAVAQAGFPGGQFNLPTFAWKIVDGDQPPHNAKEGYAGHWILRISGGFQPKVYTKGGEAVIVDPNQLKRGYYIRAYLTVKANGDATYPGIYLNPSMVEVVAFGEEIQVGPDGGAVFGGDPAATPAGASATPMAGVPIVQAVPPVAVPPVAVPPVAVPPVAVPPVAVPPVAVTPAENFLKPKVMTPKAAGATYESFVAQGWTDADMIAQGYLQP